MDTQVHSFEWFDAISRQGSKFSRASFNTAKTDCSIYYECNEFEDHVGNEINFYCDQSENYSNFKKSVTIKFPKFFPRSETRSTYRSDDYFKYSDKSSKVEFNERDRSKTAPYKKCMFDLINDISYENNFLTKPSENELINDNLITNNLAPKVKLAKENNNRYIMKSKNSSENFYEDNETLPINIDSSIERCIIIESDQNIDNLNKEKETHLQKSYHLENNQPLELFEIKLNRKPTLETKSYFYNTVNGKSFNMEILPIEGTSKITESTLNIQKNQNLNIKKLYIDLPTFFVEGKVDIKRKNGRSDCIFSMFLNCKNICFLAD